MPAGTHGPLCSYALAMYILTNAQEGYLPAATANPPASSTTSDTRTSPAQSGYVASHLLHAPQLMASGSHELVHHMLPNEHQGRLPSIGDAPTSNAQPATGTASFIPHSMARPTIPFLPPPAPLLGKRRRDTDTSPSSSAGAGSASVVAADPESTDDKIACRWTDCPYKGSAHYLWLHIKLAHYGRGIPRPTDRELCGWKGCAVQGTSLEIVVHFKEVHNDGHDSEHEAAGKKVVCERARCGVKVGRGKYFQRHAFGGHWHLRPYYDWCQTCGSFVQKYDGKRANEHAAACVKIWMEVNIRGWLP